MALARSDSDSRNKDKDVKEKKMGRKGAYVGTDSHMLYIFKDGLFRHCQSS